MAFLAPASVVSAFADVLVVPSAAAFAGLRGLLGLAAFRLGRLRGRCRGGGVGGELRGERGVLLGLAASGFLEPLALGLALLRGLGHVGGGALAVEHDVADPDDGQLLAVTLLHAPARLRPVLEADHLVATVAAQDLGGDARVRDDRAPDRGRVAVGDEQDAIERDRLAGAGLEELDLELRADLDAILLSAGLDDCVHGTPGRALVARRQAAADWSGKVTSASRGKIEDCTAGPFERQSSACHVVLQFEG